MSTRRVDDLVSGHGVRGHLKVPGLPSVRADEVVDSFLGRPLSEGPYQYVWLDAINQKVREHGRVVNVCVVVRPLSSDGKREIVGMDVGTAEDGAFWKEFLRSRPWTERCGAGDIGCAQRSEGCDSDGVCSELAAAPTS